MPLEPHEVLKDGEIAIVLSLLPDGLHVEHWVTTHLKEADFDHCSPEELAKRYVYPMIAALKERRAKRILQSSSEQTNAE